MLDVIRLDNLWRFAFFLDFSSSHNDGNRMDDDFPEQGLLDDNLQKEQNCLEFLECVTKASSNKQCTTRLCRRFNLSRVPLLGCSSTCVSLSTNASEASKVSNNRVLANTGCSNKFGIC